MDTLPMLRRLTLVTYAEHSRRLSRALTPWRMDQLWSAYRVAQVTLEVRAGSQRVHPTDDFTQQQREFLEGSGLPTCASFWLAVDSRTL
ncbi:MAG: hypothetical protein U5J83_09775 [Bryobacterales bacterium]|nr:hypothetical protein [Bryobacterales bacterium]